MLLNKIVELKEKLSEFAGLVEGMIRKSIEGLLEKNAHLLKKVIEIDETQANEFEIQLDELCTTIIAQFEPRAKDLRTILMIMKMNNDLERIADHAVNISESALFLIDKPPVKPLIDIPRMTEEASGMLKDSIDAFLKEDAKLARDVCKRDNTVDSLKNQITRELVTYMINDPKTIDRALELIRVSSNLERVADLSTNIAEDVVYIIKGITIKHHREE